MAGGMDPGSTHRGGRRPLDAPINLVPFIDLMAVTISFLIMTAVWTQVGRLQVSERPAADPTRIAESSALQFELHLTGAAVTIRIADIVLATIPHARDRSQRLAIDLLQHHLREQRGPADSAITIRADDSVRYDDLVRVVDACAGLGLVDIAVTTNG